MTDSTRLRELGQTLTPNDRTFPDPFPLNETALQAARTAVYDKCDVSAITEEATRAAISTYLAEAGFEVESQYKTISAKHGQSDPEQRLVGPWESCN